MDIQQIADIQFFYSQFLSKIRYVINNRNLNTENDKKTELLDWLNKMKKQKTFGDDCRFEIMYMLDETGVNSLTELEFRIGNMEKNCHLIRLQLESEFLTTGKRTPRPLSLYRNSA